MKKLLTVLLSFVMLFSLFAGAVTLDTAESAAEVKSEDAVAKVQAELSIPTSDPILGELVYYNDFEAASGYEINANVSKGTTLSTYLNSEFSTAVTLKNGGTSTVLTIVADPKNENGQVLKITPADTAANQYPQAYFENGQISKRGCVTFVYDITADASVTGKNFSIYKRATSDNGTPNLSGAGFSINDTTRKKWNEVSYAYELVAQCDDTANTMYKVSNQMIAANFAVADAATNYCFYIDNVRVYFKPYTTYDMSANAGTTTTFGFDKTLDVEKSTYDAGNSEATVAFDAETNKCTVTSKGYAGVVTVNAVYTDGTTETKVVKLYAGNLWKPGLNIFTGTTEDLDFDDVEKSSISKAIKLGSAMQLGKNPLKEGNPSDVIVYNTAQFCYAFTANALSTPIELERPFKYTVDIATTNGVYILINGENGNHNVFKRPGGSGKVWKTYGSEEFNLFKDAGTLTATGKGNGLTKIGIGTQSGSGYGLGTTTFQYYDNFNLTPYYKALYMNWDGSDAFNLQYFLKDADGNLMTVYTPYRKDTLAAPWEGEGYKEFIGWSTTKGATEAMTSIPLEYKDIVLYPVYKDTTAVATNTVLNGASGKNGGVFFNKKLNTDETTVNVGTTEATYAYNNANNCMVIAGAGYSGIVTINAVFFDGTTETVKVQLLGGEKWRPGLNLITGTTDTFAVNSEYEAGLAFNFDLGTGVVADPFTGEGYALYLGGVANIRYPVITSKMTQQIEAGRSVLTVFDYSGKWNNFWIIGQPNVPFNDLSGALKQNTGEWLNVITATAKGGKNFTVTRFQTDAGSTGEKGPLYLDNIAFIPYYKATYMNADGSVLETEYFLRDAAGKIMTAYTPNKTAEWTGEGKKLLTGWSTTEGGEVTETVALANADITLYPVFEDAYTVSFYGFDGEVAKEDVVLAGEYAIDYVLADENGKYFEGWKVEGTDEIVTSVNVEADVKLYPVYTAKAEDAVENVEGNEMRFDVVDGNVVSSIRFKAVISASERNAADEYGFIVTRKTFLDTMAEKAANGEAVETDLTFDFKFGGNNLFAYGAAYVADSDLDLNLGEDENGAVTFAAALSGIKNNDANHANEVMVARPYVKFTNNGKQYVFYGAKASASLVDVAKSVDTTNLPENYKKNIEDIVALAK